MDVRCDRCHTEYELDDRSVTDSGASVQCTSCGHTFIVSRKTPTPPSRPGGTPALGVQQADPAPADWLLATQEGETHRFRDLSTLHKWIVERKVTREDRVSQKGGPWRQLGDLLDLAPFFDVVAQADRVRAAEATTQFQRSTAAASVAAGAATPVARTRSQPGRVTPRAPAVPPVTEDDEDSDLYQSGQFAPPEVPTRVPLVPVIDEAFPSVYQPTTNRGAKIVSVLLVFIGLVAVAAYAGFKKPNWLPSFFKKPDGPSAEPVASAPVATPPPVAPASPPAAVAAAPASVTATAHPPPAAPGPGGHPPAAASAPATAAPAGEAAKTAPSAGGRPAAEAPAVKAKGYDRLVAEADRLLENGQTAKAQKLYEEALVAQPNGVAALTGQAYVLLDREKVMAAIGTFRRALASSPDYPPAMFGLAEAYRSQGDSAQAIEQYRRYLNVAPAGPDAHAARGQIKTLESTAGRGAEPPSPTATIPDSTTPPR